MDCSTPGLPVHHQLQSLLKLMSIKSVMPSNHLILCRPLLLLPSIFSSIRVFSNESALRIRWPKSWSFSISISPSNEYSGLISFRVSLQFKGLSRVFPNNTVQKHQFFSTQPSLQSSYNFYFGLGERAFSGLLKDVCSTSFQCIDKKQNTSEINWLRNAQTSSHLGSTLLIILWLRITAAHVYPPHCCPGYQDLGDVASLKWGSTAVSGVFSLAADIWSARLCF